MNSKRNVSRILWYWINRSLLTQIYCFFFVSNFATTHHTIPYLIWMALFVRFEWLYFETKYSTMLMSLALFVTISLACCFVPAHYQRYIYTCRLFWYDLAGVRSTQLWLRVWLARTKRLSEILPHLMNSFGAWLCTLNRKR